MNETVQLWIKGAAAAVITGASGAVLSIAVDPDHFGTANLKHLAIVAGAAGLMGLCGYLKQSPLPR